MSKPEILFSGLLGKITTSFGHVDELHVMTSFQKHLKRVQYGFFENHDVNNFLQNTENLNEVTAHEIFPIIVEHLK